MKYKIISYPETGELAFPSDCLAHAEWLAKAMLEDFGQAKIFQRIDEVETDPPEYHLLRSYSHPTEEQRALPL